MFLDLLFPKFCVGCKKFGSYICSNCRNNIFSIVVDLCPYCHKPSLLGKKHEWCKGEIDGVISLIQYKGLSKKIIKSIKYKLQYALWNEIKNLITQERIATLIEFKQHNPAAYIQIIPLHKQRLKIRGFNQVEPFGAYISLLSGYQSIDILERSKNTQQQTLIKGKKQRILNMQDAFIVKNKPVNTDLVVLLDDVFTTGSTCNEAAKVLKHEGVKSVYVFTLARG